jgi:hypothetical protein
MIGLVDRFIGRIRIGSGCWEWTGTTTGTPGYGLFYVCRDKRILAHRVSWIVWRGGLIPDGQFVCHHCDNRLCVRPGHLFLGTPSDNMADKVKKGRQSRCENAGTAVLTREQVLEIRRSSVSIRKMAAAFGVNKSTIFRIRARRLWRDMESHQQP